ncbi:hypothetical protein WOLCODRAFT_15784 [Wolfiporia cocos MD-104 SS10]|uniref:Uncharacterized protein n=1 Tax=Wolfiporia cocos (strain MD-104) TaxID=742152 RepID=A0A2H3JHU5_WOLCO|nr:hypothetical protein WOLCODRAFT_15784 [Wolfiporia cocos MD-104 SS10]
MFDFVRKRKESAERTKEGRAESDPEKTKSKYGLRRTSLIYPSRVEEMFTSLGVEQKRTRHASILPTPNDSSSENLARPAYPRARSSSCSVASSVHNLRNPFGDYSGDSAMTASQVALMESTSRSIPPPKNMGYVVSHAPMIVNHQAERAEICYPGDLADSSTDNVDSQSRDLAISSDPFADEMQSVSHSDAHDAAQSSNHGRPEVSTADIARKSTTPSRRPMDYLQVKIPAAILSPPLADSHRKLWARIQ